MTLPSMPPLHYYSDLCHHQLVLPFLELHEQVFCFWFL